MSWQVEHLDLPAYLRRIGYDGPPAADEATLTALHRAQVATIPFENLDIVLGSGVAVDLPSVQRKLVDGLRGGYCYELGTLFAAALERIGFRVDRLLARTGDPLVEPRPRTHMVLRVSAGDRVWLADVGFGSGLLEPIPLIDGAERQQGVWTFRVVRGPDGAWRLRERRDHEWTTLMTFTDEPQYPVDIDTANYNTSTNPKSPFVRQIIAVRRDETSLRSLIGHEFAVERPGEPRLERRVPDDELAAVLHREFSLLLEDELRGYAHA